LNKIDHKKFLPKCFSEEDIVEYELLCDESRRLFKDIKHDFIIQRCVLHHMFEKKGLTKPVTQEEIESVMKKYDLSNEIVYETPYDPSFKMEDVMKENLIIANEDGE
jgi:hypothetical protein